MTRSIARPLCDSCASCSTIITTTSTTKKQCKAWQTSPCLLCRYSLDGGFFGSTNLRTWLWPKFGRRSIGVMPESLSINAESSTPRLEPLRGNLMTNKVTDKQTNTGDRKQHLAGFDRGEVMMMMMMMMNNVDRRTVFTDIRQFVGAWFIRPPTTTVITSDWHTVLLMTVWLFWFQPISVRHRRSCRTLTGHYNTSLYARRAWLAEWRVTASSMKYSLRN